MLALYLYGENHYKMIQKIEKIQKREKMLKIAHTTFHPASPHTIDILKAN